MKPFAKLFSSIVTSSIWNEDDKTRVLWITMLALSDPQGHVEASVGGLAHAARLSREDCQKALKVLLSPDGDSRSSEFEGRRLEAVDRGFLILNYAKFRELGKHIDRTEYLAEKQKESRKRRQQASTVVNTPSTSVNKSSTNPSASASVSVSEGIGESERKGSPNLVPTPEDIYKAYPRHEARPDAIRAIIKALGKVGPTFLLGRTVAYAKTQPPRSRFTPLPASWFNAERYSDDPKEWTRDEQSKLNREVGPVPVLRRSSPVRVPSDAEFATAGEIARRETEKLRQQFGAGYELSIGYKGPARTGEREKT